MLFERLVTFHPLSISITFISHYKQRQPRFKLIDKKKILILISFIILFEKKYIFFLNNQQQQLKKQ